MDKIPFSDIEFSHATATDQESGKQIAVLAAHHRHTGNRLGEMEWHAHNGEISWISTNKKHQRKGVATHMLRAANRVAAHYGVSAPTMSPVHTTDGAAWAKSAGLSVPAKLSGVCRDCSTLRSETGYCPCYERAVEMSSVFIDKNGNEEPTGRGGRIIGSGLYKYDNQ